MANSSTATGVDPEYSVYVGNLNPTTALSDMEDLIYELFLQVSSISLHMLCHENISRTCAIFFLRQVHWIRCSFLMTKTQENTRAMALLNSCTKSPSNTLLT